MPLFRPKKQPKEIQTNGDRHTPKSSPSVKSPVTSPSRPATQESLVLQRSPSPQPPQIDIPKAPDPQIDSVGYLRSINAVRERSAYVLEYAKKHKTKHFKLDMEKMPAVANYVASLIRRDYSDDYTKIPPHGRWQHFEAGNVSRVTELTDGWSDVDDREKTRRLIDLFLVSVLLDAGAGTKWQYKAEDGKMYKRSEGLAIASLEMFKRGFFAGDKSNPHRADAKGLKMITSKDLGEALQVSSENPLVGLEGRAELMLGLARSLRNQEFFGVDTRPGNMIDYLLLHSKTVEMQDGTSIVPIPILWKVLTDGLSEVWPESRTKVNGESIGDAWPCSVMPSHPTRPWENIIPFHKLTQWLTYSLMVPMQRMLGVQFAGTELLTALAEYRNGGLLVDTGMLTLKAEDNKRGTDQFKRNVHKLGLPMSEVVPVFKADDDVVVEWRAITIGILDELLAEVNELLGLKGKNRLSLAQMLEAGTWKGGRELAAVSRPNSRGPPIMIISDGTVF